MITSTRTPAARRAASAAVGLTLALFALIPTAAAQRRGDYMTDDEQEAVRLAQEIDKRADAFLKIAGRRIVALTDPNAKVGDKDLERFGALPKGSQIDLLDDYRRALDELMDKIDDVYQRKGKSAPLAKAAALVRDEMAKQMPQLEALRARLSDPDAGHYLDRALETAKTLAEGIQPVLDAGAPAPTGKP